MNSAGHIVCQSLTVGVQITNVFNVHFWNKKYVFCNCFKFICFYFQTPVELSLELICNVHSDFTRLLGLGFRWSVLGRNQSLFCYKWKMQLKMAKCYILQQATASPTQRDQWQLKTWGNYQSLMHINSPFVLFMTRLPPIFQQTHLTKLGLTLNNLQNHLLM